MRVLFKNLRNKQKRKIKALIFSFCLVHQKIALTLLITASWAKEVRIVNQTPISCARSATGLRVSQTNLCASRRISTQLFSKANSGASGKAATKMVMKPNCNTIDKADKEAK